MGVTLAINGYSFIRGEVSILKKVFTFFKVLLAGATLVTAGSTIGLILRCIKSTASLGNRDDILGFPDFSNNDFPEDNSMANRK